MLSTSQIIKIEEEIEQSATAHLNAKDVDTALSHFTDDKEIWKIRLRPESFEQI